MNKSDLEKLVDIRVSEAKILLENESYHGAYYLIGYSLECAFKVCISKKVKQYDFPSKKLASQCYTHNLTDLLGVSGLRQDLIKREKQDPEFKLNWAVAKDWSESSRYECNVEATKATDLFSAVTESNSGILAWLKTFW